MSTGEKSVYSNSGEGELGRCRQSARQCTTENAAWSDDPALRELGRQGILSLGLRDSTRQRCEARSPVGVITYGGCLSGSLNSWPISRERFVVGAREPREMPACKACARPTPEPSMLACRRGSGGGGEDGWESAPHGRSQALLCSSSLSSLRANASSFGLLLSSLENQRRKLRGTSSPDIQATFKGPMAPVFCPDIRGNLVRGNVTI